MDDFESWARIVISSLGGSVLGYMFYGGLWLTVKHLPEASPLLIVLSYIGRMTLLLLGIYWLSAGDWRAVIACLAGILISRQLMIRHISRNLPISAG